MNKETNTEDLNIVDICGMRTKRGVTKQDLKGMNYISSVMLMDFPEGSSAVKKY